MRLVEQHIIRRSDSRHKAVDHACWLSKNLYNAGLYAIKQEFLRSGKWVRWMDLNKDFVQNNNPDYRALSANSSGAILKRLDRLTLRRNNKVKDYLHKASKRVVRACVENNINTLIVGYNEDWKRGIDLGRHTNQSFVCVPHGDFVGLLRYKCMRLGLRFVEVNESHTSKCSSIDGEAVCHHEVYMGRRVRRGLYRSSRDGYINADINGAVNIMRKAVGDGLGRCLFPADRGFWRNPVRINADEYLRV